MERKPHLYGCVFAIIRDSEGKVLFQKRKNTGYADGYFQIPAGHIELNESMYDALIRKMRQELDIELRKEKIELVHISHRIRKGEKSGFDLYFEIRDYEGKIKNNEPEKCELLEFRDINGNFSDFIGFDIENIKKSENNIPFSEEII